MRHLLPVLAALAACSAEQPLEPDSHSGPALAAQVYGYRLFDPVDAEVFLSCANNGLGEVVHVTGTSLETYHITQSATGQTMVQFMLLGIHMTGIGLTSGETYNVVGGPYPHSWATSIFDDSGQASFGESVAGILVERGSGEVGTFRYVTHTTVNAEGELVSNVNHFSATCFVS